MLWEVVIFSGIADDISNSCFDNNLVYVYYSTKLYLTIWHKWFLGNGKLTSKIMLVIGAQKSFDAFCCHIIFIRNPNPSLLWIWWLARSFFWIRYTSSKCSQMKFIACPSQLSIEHQIIQIIPVCYLLYVCIWMVL